MKTPKTTKGFLKMLIQISETDTSSFGNTTDDDKDVEFINNIIADIQNHLGDDSSGSLKKYGVIWEK